MNVYLITENDNNYYLIARTVNDAIAWAKQTYVSAWEKSGHNLDHIAKIYDEAVLKGCSFIGEVRAEIK